MVLGEKGNVEGEREEKMKGKGYVVQKIMVLSRLQEGNDGGKLVGSFPREDTDLVGITRHT